jgi:hypothetical protein
MQRKFCQAIRAAPRLEWDEATADGAGERAHGSIVAVRAGRPHRFSRYRDGSGQCRNAIGQTSPGRRTAGAVPSVARLDRRGALPQLWLPSGARRSSPRRHPGTVGCNSGWRIAFRDGGSWRIRQLGCNLARRGSGAREAANWFIDFGTVCSSGAWLVVGSRACRLAFGVEQ